MNLYVSNFGFDKVDDDLRELFEESGQVISTKIVMDRETGRSRGIGFVRMSSDAEGLAAILRLNNKEIEGRILQVSVAKRKEDKKPFSVNVRS